MTIEQMFCKCFGPSPLRVLDYNEMEHRLIARAARRFAKMENAEKQKKYDASHRCEAVICHGPGHQSKTHCHVKGKHTIHKTYYGYYNQLAQWKGMQVFSGYFDEPPTRGQI